MNTGEVLAVLVEQGVLQEKHAQTIERIYARAIGEAPAPSEAQAKTAIAFEERRKKPKVDPQVAARFLRENDLVDKATLAQALQQQQRTNEDSLFKVLVTMGALDKESAKRLSREAVAFAAEQAQRTFPEALRVRIARGRIALGVIVVLTLVGGVLGYLINSSSDIEAVREIAMPGLLVDVAIAVVFVVFLAWSYHNILMPYIVGLVLYLALRVVLAIIHPEFGKGNVGGLAIGFLIVALIGYLLVSAIEAGLKARKLGFTAADVPKNPPREPSPTNPSGS